MQLEKIASTPHSDRGVQNTRESGLEVLVDWVSATFIFVKEPTEILRILGISETHFSYTNNRTSHYDLCMSSHDNSINIFYCSDENIHSSGCFLNISGSGCRLFEKLSIYDWKTFFATCYSIGANFTRLDVAVDDFNNTFTIEQLTRKVKNDEVTSKFKHAKSFEKIKINGGETNGHTLYFGSSQSELQIRFYNKLEERLDRNYILDQNIKTWVRSEMQLRRERATSFIEHYLFDEIEFGALAVGVLKHYITFRVKDKNESNKSRWKVAPFWNKFLKDVESIPLVKKARETSLVKTFNWLEKNVSKSLYLYVTSSPTGATELEQLLERGKEQVKEKELLLLEDLAKNVYKKSFKQLKDEQKKYLSENIHSKRFLNISKFQG